MLQRLCIFCASKLNEAYMCFNVILSIFYASVLSKHILCLDNIWIFYAFMLQCYHASMYQAIKNRFPLSLPNHTKFKVVWKCKQYENWILCNSTKSCWSSIYTYERV